MKSVTSAESKVLLLGLKGSGKTSFLAALWHLIESSEVETRLVGAKLQSDREHLNSLRNKWLNFEEQERTGLQSQKSVTLNLKSKDDPDRQIELVLPDFSGEAFRRQWETRQIDQRLGMFEREAKGVLLFVHPKNIKESDLIAANETVRERRKGSGDQTRVLQVDSLDEVSKWDYEHAPTQVQLVELLQFLFYLQEDSSGLRIAVIVSAWDLIKERLTPSAWLERRIPLLHQYLQANEGEKRFQVYGVSAIGGSLPVESKTLKKQVPAKRILVMNERLKTSHDLTLPIEFLLSQEAR